MKTVAIIPARGGSKRIPRKNIKNFAGQPIIKYSIDAALASGCFDEVMVSTDDPEIAELSRSFGAAVPFLRSKENSLDTAVTVPVLKEVIEEYKKRGQEFDYLCSIFATAPFLSPRILKTAKEMLIQNDADAVWPILKFSYPIQRALRMKENNLMMVWPENINARSQELETTYHDAGQFHFFKTSSVLKAGVELLDKTLAIEVSAWEAQDIDNEEDWKLAEVKFKILRNSDLWSGS